ncbi:hypothetical protein Goshw_021257 [Gossypium schwendimanii]|uniref:DUF7745 domain-containing protein n=1 Tax=Gossypium schwendimanii TaxID=34291 RepID=A0A7J9N9L5_GOSSC|nr:hypothetical protein [Gossypium schwendimanii]
MENEFLDKTEDNVTVPVWSERMQLEKGDSLIESCFTFGKVDLVPTVEEYTALLRCLRIQVDKGYSRAVNVPTFIKKLMNVTGISEQWKKVNVFALSIYGLIIFPKALGHVDELLLAWFHSHFWKVDKVSYQVFFESYSPLKELVKTLRYDDITEERWITILQNLQDEDIEWKAPWMLLAEIRYRCGDFDWVPLLGIWGAIGYAPLLVLRQYRSRQRWLQEEDSRDVQCLEPGLTDEEIGSRSEDDSRIH